MTRFAIQGILGEHETLFDNSPTIEVDSDVSLQTMSVLDDGAILTSTGCGVDPVRLGEGGRRRGSWVPLTIRSLASGSMSIVPATGGACGNEIYSRRPIWNTAELDDVRPRRCLPHVSLDQSVARRGYLLSKHPPAQNHLQTPGSHN